MKKIKKTYYKIIPNLYRIDEYKDGDANLYKIDNNDNIIELFIGAGKKIQYLRKCCTGFSSIKDID